MENKLMTETQYNALKVLHDAVVKIDTESGNDESFKDIVDELDLFQSSLYDTAYSIMNEEIFSNIDKFFGGSLQVTANIGISNSSGVAIISIDHGIDDFVFGYHQGEGEKEFFYSQINYSTYGEDEEENNFQLGTEGMILSLDEAIRVNI